MQSSNSPSKISVPFADSGQKATIPVDSQIGIEDARASYEDGFPPLTRTPLAAGGKPPFGTDMNGILYAITIIQQWQSAGGMFKYDSAFSAAIGGYPKGALLLKADSSGYWQNTVENNTTNPDVSGVGWIDFATSALVSLTGAVQGFAMNSVPAGWLKCNGSAVSRTTYSALFAAIGVTYGAGDGSTTFNLPDMRGEFARGLDDGRGIDSGRVIGSSQIGSLISYDPTVAAPALSGVHPTSSDATIRVDLGLDIPQAGSYPNADVVTGTSSATFTVAQAAGVARPRNVALLYCIKA